MCSPVYCQVITVCREGYLRIFDFDSGHSVLQSADAMPVAFPGVIHSNLKTYELLLRQSANGTNTADLFIATEKGVLYTTLTCVFSRGETPGQMDYHYELDPFETLDTELLRSDKPAVSDAAKPTEQIRTLVCFRRKLPAQLLRCVLVPTT